MTNKWTMSGLILALAIPFPVSKASTDGARPVTEMERLEQAVRNDQAALRYAGAGMSLRNAQIEKQQARERLASDQAALDAFKTAGPQATRLAQLEAAVQRDQSALANAGVGLGKMVDVQAERKRAAETLARDQAALEAFKTAAPRADILRLEQAVRDDEAALRYAGVGKHQAYARQERAKALQRLEADRAALGALKAQ